MQDKYQAKIVKLHPMQLAAILSQGNKLGVKAGIPEGSSVIGAGYDANSNSFYLQVTHDSFTPVVNGQLLPHLDITLEDLSKKSAIIS